MIDGLIGTPDLAEASGARPDQILHWIRKGILIPAIEAHGHGTPNLFTPEHIIEATQYLELMNAGLSCKQLRHLATVQRAALADLPADERLIRRFEIYIATIVRLAEIFGKGPGFEAWHARQQEQLARMRSAAPRPDARGRRGPGSRDRDRHAQRVLEMFLKRKPETQASALAG